MRSAQSKKESVMFPRRHRHHRRAAGHSRAGLRIAAACAVLAGCGGLPESHDTTSKDVTTVEASLNASTPGMGSGILWYQRNSSQVHAWDMADNILYKDVTIGGADPSWTIAGTGDFNADGHGDILW